MELPKKIFISYAHKDKAYLDELEKHLQPWERKKKIMVWTDRDVTAGQEWGKEVKQRLGEAEIVLFLVSPDFLASDYINDSEIKAAVEKQKQNQNLLIPVIIRPVDLELLDFNSTKVVPEGERAISEWESQDNAWKAVMQSLKKTWDLSHDNEDGGGTKQGPGPADRSSGTKILNMAVMVMFLMLIAVSIGLFVYGAFFERGDWFYISAAMVGIAAGIGGFLIARSR
jgi:hypothetical protein